MSEMLVKSVWLQKFLKILKFIQLFLNFKNFHGNFAQATWFKRNFLLWLCHFNKIIPEAMNREARVKKIKFLSFMLAKSKTNTQNGVIIKCKQSTASIFLMGKQTMYRNLHYSSLHLTCFSFTSPLTYPATETLFDEETLIILISSLSNKQVFVVNCSNSERRIST